VDLLGWLIFLVALLFSVMLHESGHFWTAKKFGMKCTQYFLGFGPTVWSVHRGETEYGIKALPVGGFVKIVGMTSLDEVDEADEPRSFRRAPGWQRLIVLAAGSFMHFVLAFLLIFGLGLALGVEHQNTTQLQSVESCVPANAKAITNNVPCAANAPKSPAALAGLKGGDKVTSFGGAAVSNWSELTAKIEKAKPGVPVPITVDRDGRTLNLRITPTTVPGRAGPYLGVLENPVIFESTGPIGAVKYAATGFAQTITGSVQALGNIPAAVPKLFSKDRSQTAAGNVTSVVGAAEATGQAVAANVGWEYKVSFVLLLVASLNIFVGLFNLVPLLPMDGGHIAVVIWERIRAWFARLRGRADPGLVDYQKLIPVSFSVFMVLVVFGVMLILADIVNPVNIG
jgi:membrane-associated protease RseP (regulator of RpoE activity)